MRLPIISHLHQDSLRHLSPLLGHLVFGHVLLLPCDPHAKHKNINHKVMLLGDGEVECPDGRGYSGGSLCLLSPGCVEVGTGLSSALCLLLIISVS